MVDTEIEEIIWCYGVSQNRHSEIAEQITTPIRFYEGIPQMEDIQSKSKLSAKIIIVDDLMGRFSNEVVDLFTMQSHHLSLSILNSVQNIFHKGKGSRDTSLNSHYLVIFNNPRDRAQISHFARQIDPQNSKFIIEAYRDATQRPYGYLLFDCTQQCDENKRIRIDIFPGESNLVYVPKNSVVMYK